MTLAVARCYVTNGLVVVRAAVCIYRRCYIYPDRRWAIADDRATIAISHMPPGIGIGAV